MKGKIKNIFAKDVHLSELIKGSSAAFIFKIFGMGVGYISMLYITNNFGASVFGTLTLVVTVLLFFSLIPSFGMDLAVVRIVGDLYTHNKYAEISYSLIIIIIFTFFLSLLFVMLLKESSEYIASNILNKIYLREYLEVISIAIISNTILVITSATFQAMKETKRFIFFQTVLHQLFFIFLLMTNDIFFQEKNIIQIYVNANLLSATVAFILLLMKMNSFGFFLKQKKYKYSFFKIIKISSPMLFSASFLMLMTWMDIIMIGMFKTEADVGVYSAALRVAALTSLALIAVNSIATPKFIEFYAKKDMDGLSKIAKQSTKLICLISFPLLIIYLIFSKQIMGLFGNEFTVGASVLLILSTGQFVNAISGSVGYIMQMTDNQKIFQNVMVIASLINISLNYILIPKYGIDGAAYASVISMIFWNVSLVLFVKRKLGFWTFFLLPEKTIK